jgi:putative ABC transport system permease protein
MGVPLARRNLLAEPVRLAMSVGGVAFAVLLVLTIVSLYRGWSEAGGVIRELPGELWVGQAGTRDPFRSSSSLPAGRAGALAGLPGVAAVLPVGARRVAFTRGGRDLDAFFFAFGAPAGTAAATEGARELVPAPGSVVVDASTARDAEVAAGDTLTILGRRLRVAAVRPGGNPLFGVGFMHPRDAAGLLSPPGRVAFYLLTLRPGADAAAAAAAAERAVPGARVVTGEAFAEATSQLVRKGFLPVVGVLVALGVVIGAAVTALTTYTATVERARDYGVLKAIGAPRGYVARVVVAQSLFVAVLGAALGTAAAVAVASLARRRVPEFVTDLRPADAALVVAATLAVSVLAAWVPLRRIERIDPAMVFRA